MMTALKHTLQKKLNKARFIIFKNVFLVGVNVGGKVCMEKQKIIFQGTNLTFLVTIKKS